MIMELDVLPDLPIKEVLLKIRDALGEKSNLVLVAPPGAGKTTLVPLALLDCDWREGRKIYVLEPRRLAARAAATRMASLLGERVGEQVGYRVRFDTKVSERTIIEVVTEGVFNRILSSDPGLEHAAAVLFDEFHERSLDGDLALALCLDLQAGLREDLRLLPMSATLDGAAVSRLMNAQTIESKGRSFPVEVSYAERRPTTKIEVATADVIRSALAEETEGSILVFLPGQREIEQTYRLLDGRLPNNVELHRLYGALSQSLQDGALKPVQPGQRKVVLSSAIAETSLTIDGVTIVIDSGLSRQPVFEPSTGLIRLQTQKASLASVVQRAGRAGRLEPGKAIRLWRKEQTNALVKQSIPEILNADLTALVLELADWGIKDPAQLKWLDQPPAPALAEATKLLTSFGALDSSGLITAYGRQLKNLPLPIRFSHMVLQGAEHSKQSAKLAALLSLLSQERGVGGNSADLAVRAEQTLRSSDQRSKRLVQLSKRISSSVKSTSNDDEALSAGVLLGNGLTDRIAQNRGASKDGAVRFRLANGRGAELDATDPLSREPHLVVVDMIGKAGAARIVSAAALSKNDVIDHFSGSIDTVEESKFDPETGVISATRSTKLGALTLDKPVPVKLDPAQVAGTLIEAIREHGLELLPWRDQDVQFRNRLSLLSKHLGEPWPPVNDEALLAKLEDWLLPFLSGVTSLSNLEQGALINGLRMLAGHPSDRDLSALVPSHFSVPSGSNVPLAYKSESVTLSVRPQELFGLDRHPSILSGNLPLNIELLSPAGRPIQITGDLPGFWRGSWKDVRADLRGRYPKHNWPEDPLTAEPTSRAKPRKR